MSDRILYPVGNTARRDVINWPTILRSEIAAIVGVLTDDQKDARWPVDISLLQAMAINWRVKKWNLTGTCNVSVRFVRTVFPFTDNTWTGEADVEGDLQLVRADGNPATREQDLVGVIYDPVKYRALVNGGIGTPIGIDPVQSTWSTLRDAGSPFSGTADLAIQFPGLTLFDEGTEQFSPPFFGFGDPPGTIGNVIPIDHTENLNQLGLTVSFDRNPETDLSPASPVRILEAGTLTIISGIQPDFDVPLQLAAQLDFFDPDGDLTGTISGDFTLEATEFWPFANSDGDPVYSTGDGSQLIDPFS